MNQVAYFEIQSDNPEISAKFYSEVFGWEITKDEFIPDYWRIKTDGINGGLLKRPTQIPPLECGTNAFTNSMQVENYDEIAKKILENGGQEAMPKFAVPGKCWQGYFIDADHNVFGIFEVDENAK